MSSQGTARAAARPVDATAQARARERLERSATPPWLHGEVARRMAERLPLFRQVPSQVLDAWTPAGGSDPVLRTALPRARIDRLGLPVVALPWWSPRRWSEDRRRVEESTLRAGHYELVWANMLLHHQADPAEMLRRWHQSLAVDGYLMFSCLGPDTLGELRELYARAGWPPPSAPFTDMHDWGDLLLEAGFAEPVMDMETIRLSFETPARLVAELRELGRNLHPQRPQGLRGRRWRDELFARMLMELARPDEQGRLVLRFEIVYGHAFKAATRHRVAPESAIGLDEFRSALRERKKNLGNL